MTSAVPAQTDVLVVGAGPAGLAASQWLNAAGVRVVLVEARERVGSPMRCGEFTRPDYFEQIGLPVQAGWLRPPRQIGIHLNSGLDAAGRPGRTALYARPWHWVSLDRAASEYGMSRLLTARGVTLLESCAVTAVSAWQDGERRVVLRQGTTTRHLRARLVIAADGASSLVSRFAGLEGSLRMENVISYHGYLKEGLAVPDQERSDIFLYDDLMPFYFWMFPCGEGRVNFGVGMHGSRGHLARQVLDAKLALSPYAGQGRIVHRIIGWTPSDYPMVRPYADGLMVCGTAARLVGATSGEGIYYAAVSGRAAAEQFLSLQGAMPEAEALAGYRKRLRPIYDQLHYDMDQRLRLEKKGLF